MKFPYLRYLTRTCFHWNDLIKKFSALKIVRIPASNVTYSKIAWVAALDLTQVQSLNKKNLLDSKLKQNSDPDNLIKKVLSHSALEDIFCSLSHLWRVLVEPTPAQIFRKNWQKKRFFEKGTRKYSSKVPNLTFLRKKRIGRSWQSQGRPPTAGRRRSKKKSTFPD